MDYFNLNAEAFASLNFITAIFASFALGFLSSLTPCVYPLIPITLALFGADQEKNLKERFFLALFYVFGIGLTYTILGLISAKTGAVFGQFLGHPIVIISLSILMFALALMSLDILKIDLIHLRNKASKLGGSGYKGAFLMGAVSGLVAAPCVGPALVMLLSVAASSQSLFWGASLLASYSFGLGLIFLILSVFSGLLDRLPRSGNWLNFVKFLIAAGVLVVSFFFIKSVMPHWILDFLTNIPKVINYLISIFALALAWFANNKSKKILEFIACLVLAFALANIFLLEKKIINHQTVWLNSVNLAIQTAKKDNKKILLDLSADWCIACKELDEKTFQAKNVIPELEKLVLTRIDFTNFSAESEELSKKYNIAGLPAVLFLDQNGNELANTRISGFIGPEQFIEHLKKIN